MRMWKSITKNKKLILSEAPMHGEDFQLTGEDLGEDEQEGFQSTDVQDPNNQNGQQNQNMQQQNQIPNEQDPNAPENDMMMGDEEQGMGGDQMGDGMDGGFNEPQVPEETEEDRLKKIILLKQYKALYERLSDVKFTLTYIKRMKEYADDENIEYIERQLEDIDEKINDTLAHHFLSSQYRDLLRLFYYLKYQVVALTDMLAKVTGASLDASKDHADKDNTKKGKRKIKK